MFSTMCSSPNVCLTGFCLIGVCRGGEELKSKASLPRLGDNGGASGGDQGVALSCSHLALLGVIGDACCADRLPLASSTSTSCWACAGSLRTFFSNTASGLTRLTNLPSSRWCEIMRIGRSGRVGSKLMVPKTWPPVGDWFSISSDPWSSIKSSSPSGASAVSGGGASERIEVEATLLRAAASATGRFTWILIARSDA